MYFVEQAIQIELFFERDKVKKLLLGGISFLVVVKKHTSEYIKLFEVWSLSPFCDCPEIYK